LVKVMAVVVAVAQGSLMMLVMLAVLAHLA
jgi:hypothetical protein